jgi:polysaccharide pyruvyl transferase WcaK-like protein
MNFNTLLLSVFLFVSRWVLRKKIYLLGTGYYNSTTKIGHWAAWLAGKAANAIIARDPESAENFSRVSKNVYQDADIAWNIPGLNLSPYYKQVERMQKKLLVGGKTLLAALRRPQAKSQSSDFVRYNHLVTELAKSNPDRPIILVMLESEAKNSSIYKQARALRRRHKHLRILEAPYNPLTLFLYIKQNRNKLCLVAPQLHLIMTAQLAGVPFWPMAYDNKVSMLLDQIGVPAKDRIDIKDASIERMQKFTDQFFGGKK